MTDATFADAMGAAEELARLAALCSPTVIASTKRFALEGTITSPSTVLRQASDTARAGVMSTLELTRDEANATLVTRYDGSWTASPETVLILTHLTAGPLKAAWSTDDLLGHGGDAELDSVDSVHLRIEVDKSRWSEPIARETGRSVWIGRSRSELASWLSQEDPTAAVNALFGGERTGALLLLLDWEGDSIDAGPRLTIGNLDTRVQAPDEPPALSLRIAERRDVPPLPHWRALDIELTALPDDLRGPLTRLVGIAATGLIVEEDEPGPLRPSVLETTIWPRLPSTVGSAPVEADAIIALARWVAEELTQARLDAARHVAATSIPDPLATGDPERIVEVAQMTYHLLVHRDALASLDHQQKLEEAFHELDAKADELRVKLGESVEAAVTKALAAALAIAIAALASPKVRNLPATIAAAVLALYLAGSGWALLGWYRRDAESRLNAAKAAAAGRLKGVGKDLDKIVDGWLRDLIKRIKVAAAILFALALVLLLGGLFADSGVRKGLGIESGKRGTAPARHALSIPRVIDVVQELASADAASSS